MILEPPIPEYLPVPDVEPLISIPTKSCELFAPSESPVPPLSVRPTHKFREAPESHELDLGVKENLKTKLSVDIGDDIIPLVTKS